MAAIVYGALATIAAFGWLVVLRRVQRKARHSAERQRALEPGHVAQAEGDLSRAVSVYGEVARSSASAPQLVLSARLFESSVHLQAGSFDAADALLALVVQQARGPLLSELRVAAETERALVAALRGRTAEAQRLYDATTKSFAHTLDVPFQTKQRLVLVSAIIKARTDRASDALRLLEARWPVIVQGGGSTLRLALLVRAWLAAAASGPRDAGNADRWVAAVRALDAGELLPMCEEWPALTTFAASAGL